MWVEERERERLFGIENTYCWLCWWQCNCLPFLRPGWQCWPHWPSAGPGRGGPLQGRMGTNCPWRHHHETEQHPLLSRNKEIPLDRDTGKGNSQWWGGGRCGLGWQERHVTAGTMVSEDMWNQKAATWQLWSDFCNWPSGNTGALVHKTLSECKTTYVIYATVTPKLVLVSPLKVIFYLIAK